ncbi:Hypothetical protein A7982_00779 [Minicystis rosea]|nr:Hypothetical protein A7982_00779 [Minicystis rosea]
MGVDIVPVAASVLVQIRYFERACRRWPGWALRAPSPTAHEGPRDGRGRIRGDGEA